MSGVALTARGFPKPIEYYDVHVYYRHEDSDDVASAEQLHQELRATFPDLRIFELVGRPIGPHPVAMFEAHLYSPQQFSLVVSWLAVNRREHSVLIHPNTPSGLLDHSHHAIWLGRPLPLNLSIFSK